MCVIAIKPKNVSMPDDQTIQRMWRSNPDGAGFMWADGKTVHIQKGFMTIEAFQKALKKLGQKYDLAKLPIVLHFRIGTAGGNIPANTHPFPVTDSIELLQRTEIKAAVGVAHNGVIPIKPRQTDISDTMEYVASQIAPLLRYDHEFYRSKDLLSMIYNATTSKWAIMNAEGEIVTIGEFQEREGILYSNLYFDWEFPYRRGSYNYVGYYGNGSYFWDDDDDGFEEEVSLMLLPMDACLFDEETGMFLECGYNVIMMDEWGIPYAVDQDFNVAFPIKEDARVYDSMMRNFQFDPNKAVLMHVSFNADVSMVELFDDDNHFMVLGGRNTATEDAEDNETDSKEEDGNG